MAKKQLIIMDEVDGMAGGDRGGVAQMIAFIKKTQVSLSTSTALRQIFTWNYVSCVLRLCISCRIGSDHLYL